MKYILLSSVLLSVMLALSNPAHTSNKSSAPPKATSKTIQRYPIAPGVWYPGFGEMHEKPVRYYRVRCWPGCHSGSSHGKYPEKPLNMKPIFPTSTIDLIPGSRKKSK